MSEGVEMQNVIDGMARQHNKIRELEAELARVTAERDRLRAAIEAALPLTRGTATMVLSEELLSPLGRKILADDDDEPHAGG